MATLNQPLTLADIARHPRPGTAVPRRVAFTPDGRSVIWLFSVVATLVQQLWIYDVATGARRCVTGDETSSPVQQSAFSLDEELRRERGRVREQGVTDYHLVADAAGAPVLLIPGAGTLSIVRGLGAPVALPIPPDALDARLSPTATHVAFVRDGDLYVLDLEAGRAPHRLTEGAESGLTHGLADYVAQEEMDRSEGYWWHPQGTSVAYVEADSRAIPLYPIMHQGREIPLVEQHRYPFAGAANTAVRLGVVPLAGGPTVWMDLPLHDGYLARVVWRPDGTLTALLQSRDQRTLRLFRCDPSGGPATLLLEEVGEPWLNLADDLRFLNSGEMLWSSERTGFRHLSLHDADGRLLRVLTEGHWVVTGVAAVDERRRVVYFHATRENVLERRLYAVSLDGGALWLITAGAGWHETILSPDCTLFVDSHSDLAAAPSLTLRRMNDGAELAVLHADSTARAARLGLLPPELTAFAAEDGTPLQAAIYLPPAAAKSGHRYPLIVSVYGGPHVQAVANRWDLTVDLRAQYLAQQGFVVLKVDNRGSAHRGLTFEAAIAGQLGRVEVADQLAAVRAISGRPYVDGDRVGVYGWSYGGYMTCCALMDEPEVFKVGVAGAPVTHWDGYDTHYTERYMGQPSGNAQGYQDSSVLARVARLQGKLLLIHGMVDENVHARHSLRLVQALIAAGKDFDFLPFPEERHMPRDEQGLLYLERRLAAYFMAYL